MPSANRTMGLVSRNPIFSVLGLLTLGGFAFLLTGCDGRPSRVNVSGNVTVDGKPIDFGGVAFKPVGGGRLAGGPIQTGGGYTVTMYQKGDGIPVGSYKVSISSVEPISDRAHRWHAPKKYAQPETSELTVEITKATSELNFDLTWEGDKHAKPWVEKL